MGVLSAFSYRLSPGAQASWAAMGEFAAPPPEHPRNRAFLLDLEEALSLSTTGQEIIRLVCRLTGEYLGASRCYFAEVEAARVQVLVQDDWHSADKSSIAGTYSMSDFLPREALAVISKSGLTINDVRSEEMTRGSARNFEAISVVSFAVAPYIRGGEFVAMLAASDSQPRSWRPDEIDLLRTIAARAWPLVERAREEHDRRRAEEALRRSEERLRLSYRAAGVGAWEWSADSGEVFWSPEYREIYGLDPDRPGSFEEGIGVVLAEDRAAVEESMREALLGGKEYRSEHRIRHPRRGLRWVQAIGSLVPDSEGGGPRRMLGIVRDVTEQHLIQDEVRESEAQLRVMADSIPQLAWIADAEGWIFWYNRGWYDYTGTTLEQMQGWGWQSVHDPAVLPSVMERWKSSIATGRPFEMEFPLRSANREFHWFLTRVNPLRSADGKVVRWFGTNTDIDQARQVRVALEEETRALDLLNKTGAMLASKRDLQSVVQGVTDAATEMSGAQFGAFFYNATDAKGDSLILYTLTGAPREAFDKFGQPRATALFGPTFLGGPPIRSDDVAKDPRYGKLGPHHGMPRGHLPVRSYLAVSVVSRTGEPIGGLFFGHPEPGVFTERSERIVVGLAAQAAVAIDNARLYEAAAKAAEGREALLQSERAARAEAERMSRLKDQFLATVSHEVRTPLSAILGWSHVLRQGRRDEDDLAKGLEAIDRNARVQARLIDDLLDMSRINSGKLRLEVTTLDPVASIEAALETLRPAAMAKRVRIERVLDSGAGPICGDPNRLQQIVWNLLSNAIKFTPRGGRVQVVLRRVASHVEITVADTGVGFAPEFKSQMFERFTQADASTTRNFGGLGLGLSIVKHLVELHGGTITATSPGEGMGSTFTVRLPLTAVQGESEDAGAAPSLMSSVGANLSRVSLKGTKVLVVDDDADSRELINRVLTDCSAAVITAASALEGLALIERERPDVLVSDIGMPEVDGYEFLRRARALGRERGGMLPAIALTAFARSEDRIRALHAGFLVHVAKPVEPLELVHTVATVVARN